VGHRRDLGLTDAIESNQESALSSLEVSATWLLLSYQLLFPTTQHIDNIFQRLQRTHLDLQQYQENMLSLQQQQQLLHELQHTRSQQSSSSLSHHHHHHQQQQQQQQESSSSQNETVKSFRSSPSFRDHSTNSGRPQDSSSDSEGSQGCASFVRADLQTTRRTGSSSASASSLPSSVASSQEFQGRWTGSEAESPAQSLVLESGFHLR